MATWNRLIAITGEEGEVEWYKEGEGTSQRTCMNYTWTMGRGLSVGKRGRLGGRKQKGKKEIGTIVMG